MFIYFYIILSKTEKMHSNEGYCLQKINEQLLCCCVIFQAKSPKFTSSSFALVSMLFFVFLFSKQESQGCGFWRGVEGLAGA